MNSHSGRTQFIFTFHREFMRNSSVEFIGIRVLLINVLVYPWRRIDTQTYNTLPLSLNSLFVYNKEPLMFNPKLPGFLCFKNSQVTEKRNFN